MAKRTKCKHSPGIASAFYREVFGQVDGRGTLAGGASISPGGTITPGAPGDKPEVRYIKLEQLFEPLGVKRGDYRGLALRLANQWPNIKVFDERPKRGGPKKWAGAEGIVLIQEVHGIKLGHQLATGRKLATAAALRILLTNRGVLKPGIRHQKENEKALFMLKVRHSEAIRRYGKPD